MQFQNDSFVKRRKYKKVVRNKTHKKINVQRNFVSYEYDDELSWFPSNSYFNVLCI